MTYNNGLRTVTARFAVLRNGVEFAQLTAKDEPTVRMVSSAKIKMAFSGIFIKNNAVDFLVDRIKPYLIIDGREYPVGEYIITTEQTQHENGASYIEIEGYDVTYLAERCKLEERLTLKANNRYTDVIQALFISAGVEKIICEESDARLQTDREDWEIGTDHLTIANALLTEINYDSAWADMDGFVHLHPHRPPDASNITHTYASGELSIIKDDLNVTNDLHDKCNVFRAEVSNPELDEIMVATSVNDDPSHPLCVQRLGRIQAPIQKLDNIASQAALQDYIDRIKFESMLATETVVFKTATNPTHTVGNTLALNHPRLQGIFAETEWSMSLAAGAEMTHKARRVMYL